MNPIEKAKNILVGGGVIVYPTDTIWGIGCDATNLQAVNRIYQIKERTDKQSMLVLVDGIEMIYQYVEAIPGMAYELIKITAHPMTIIYPKAKNLAPNLVPSDGSIGIRICQDPVCRVLIQSFGKPIVSTSANKSGHPFPVRFTDIQESILQAVDFVLESQDKRNIRGKPSSIIKLDMDNRIQIIRP